MDCVLVLLEPLEGFSKTGVRFLKRAQVINGNDDLLSDDLNPALRFQVLEGKAPQLASAVRTRLWRSSGFRCE